MNKATYWKRDRGEKFQTVTVGNAAVKIYRRGRGRGKARRWVFEVVDHTRGPGLRRLRGFGDYREAHAEAKRLAEQLATGEAAAAQMLGSEAASYGRALELLRPTGLSLELAAASVAKSFEILQGDNMVEAARFFSQHRVDRLVRRTVAEVVAELVEAKKSRGKSARYVRNLSNQLTRFAESFAVDISNVTGPDIQNWLDRLKVAPRTAKNFRGTLYTFFAFAEARAYILRGSNPVATVEQISTKGDGAIEIYSPAEIRALLAAAPREFLPVVAIGAFAGVRTAEIERLEWRDIDLAGGLIHISAAQAKTRSRRLVPIVPNLAQWLAPYAGQRGKVWKGDANDLQEARAESVAKSGVGWKHNALRHSAISYRLAAIQDVAQVALEAGNTPNVIFKNYRELVRPEAARTWFAVTPEQPENVVTLKTEAAQ
jgi:integrase